MSLVNNEAKILIEKLKPYITIFSEEIRRNGEHKQKVACGGKIKYIVDSRNWTDSDPQIVYVTIDDAVGEQLIVVPAPVWDELDAVKNDVVVARGMLWQIEKETTLLSRTGAEIKRSRFEPLRVLVSSIEKLK